ncbi:hypothetical protein T484DRAFT_1832618 [Baffinella frigidus]|nr:hypothetical protein T484DRAFT_1832618 [Cryptophyta sp. CCMP2293]
MSGHNHNEGGAHGPEATPGKVGLREKLTHPHGHKDHPKDESDGGDPVHELPTHAQKDAYSAEAAASSKHAMKRHTVHAGEYVGQSMGGKRHGKGSYTKLHHATRGWVLHEHASIA